MLTKSGGRAVARGRLRSEFMTEMKTGVHDGNKELEHLELGIRKCLHDGKRNWHGGNKRTGASEAGEPCILPVSFTDILLFVDCGYQTYGSVCFIPGSKVDFGGRGGILKSMKP